MGEADRHASPIFLSFVMLRTLIHLLALFFLFFMIAALAGVLFFAWLTRDMCGNDFSYESISPDGQYRAIVFQRDCGATTDFSTRVAILKADEAFTDKIKGNIFIMDGHPDDTRVQVYWFSPRTLTISYQNGFKIFLQKDRFQDIDIRYTPVPAPEAFRSRLSVPVHLPDPVVLGAQAILQLHLRLVPQHLLRSGDVGPGVTHIARLLSQLADGYRLAHHV